MNFDLPVRMDTMLKAVLAAYGLNDEAIDIRPFGNGLINATWKVTANRQYILQRINSSVFNRPEDIDHNIGYIESYLKDHHPQYHFPSPKKALNGAGMILMEGAGYFRLFSFIPGSRSVETANTPHEAFEAARQFGRLTRLTAEMDVRQLRNTIPQFHNLALRYQQFQQSVKAGIPDRLRKAAKLTNDLFALAHIADAYKNITADPGFRLRVTHHDTKISNVLFDEYGNGLCVIDLDTLMPGYFISDVGDMMRTFLSPVNEEETDLSKIEVREDFYNAIVQGYLSEMEEELTEKEKSHFFYAGQFAIYMQALRFLTDYLNGDVYYHTTYDEHNLIRSVNQLTLLKKLRQSLF